MFESWKTTAAGFSALLIGAGHLVTQLALGHYDPGLMIADLSAILTGFGLVLAQDA